MSNKIICPHCDSELALDKLQEASISKMIGERKEQWDKEQNEKMKQFEEHQNEILLLKEEQMKIKISKEVEEENKNSFKEQKEQNELLSLRYKKIKDDYSSDVKRKEAEIEQGYKSKVQLVEYQYEEQLKQDRDKMEKVIESMSNKGSSQVVGEAGENYIVEELKKYFPEDSFIEISKGESGGDWIQNVNDDAGNTVGQIYIESKNTKIYSGSWVPKFQKDMEEREITTGVIISKNFPKEHQGENSFNDRGIPVYKLDSNIFASHIALIREHIKKTFLQVQLGQLENSDIPLKLFEYLNSDMYKNAIQQLVNNFTRHRIRIEARKKTFQKIINEDNQLLKEGVIQISKIFKDDINRIADDEVISLPKLDEMKSES